MDYSLGYGDRESRELEIHAIAYFALTVVGFQTEVDILLTKCDRTK